MSLLSREQVAKSWHEKNPNISFFDLLYAIEQHKSISTEYGLNVSIEQHWRFGDPTRRQLHRIGMTMKLHGRRA